MDEMIVNVKREYAKDLIKKQGGKFFTAVFKGKHDAATHRMNGRTGVFKYLKGQQVFNELSPDLLKAFNVHAMDYRTVHLDGIVEIRCQGKVYTFV